MKCKPLFIILYFYVFLMMSFEKITRFFPISKSKLKCPMNSSHFGKTLITFGYWIRMRYKWDVMIAKKKKRKCCFWCFAASIRNDDDTNNDDDEDKSFYRQRCRCAHNAINSTHRSTTCYCIFNIIILCCVDVENKKI